MLFITVNEDSAHRTFTGLPPRSNSSCVSLHLVVWQAGSREDGDFLPSGDAVHAIDGRYSRLDHLLRVDTALRVYRLAWNINTTIHSCKSRRMRCVSGVVSARDSSTASLQKTCSRMNVGTVCFYKSQTQ